MWVGASHRNHFVTRNKRGASVVITVSGGAYPTWVPASKLVVLCWLVDSEFVCDVAESS